MLESIDSWDKVVLKWVNNSTLLDPIESILIWLRHPLVWIPIYVFFISLIIFNFRKGWYRILLYLIASISLTDLTSAKFLKPFIGRLRPCHQSLDFELVERISCGGLYSFTSNHAANHFAISTFLYLVLRFKFPQLKYPLFIWAGLVSFCQVYVGKHFPGDVIFGAGLGMLIASLFYIVYRRFEM